MAPLWLNENFKVSFPERLAALLVWRVNLSGLRRDGLIEKNPVPFLIDAPQIPKAKNPKFFVLARYNCCLTVCRLLQPQILAPMSWFTWLIPWGHDPVRSAASPLKNPCEIHLEPVVLIEMKGHSLEEVVSAATKAAQAGMENTKNMVATMGKAKNLAKRAIRHPDPGALSTYLILSLMTEYLLSGNS